jgi:hypothetical protein
MKQLATARAVISIWTSNSIRSDCVRSEAGTAKREGKLIPVKTPDVAYANIPLPFGEMHTENVASTDLIRAAVIAQLAKPAVHPTAWALLTKGFKYEILTWFGIVGGALTLFGALDAALKLAPATNSELERVDTCVLAVGIRAAARATARGGVMTFHSAEKFGGNPSVEAGRR